MTGSDDGWVVTRNAGPGFTTSVAAGAHALVVDEPASVGGSDAGPTPYDLLLGALGTCTAITVRMYAARKRWPLEEVVVSLRSGRSHADDCAECVEMVLGPGAVAERIEFVGALTDEQRKRLRYIASRCPVKQLLQTGITVHDASAP